MAGNNRGGSSNQKPNKTILSRTLILAFVCGIVAFVVLGCKLYQVQIIRHDELEEKAVEQQTRETTVTASRGTIYDVNGKTLAVSASAETVFISPYEIVKYKEPLELIASTLSEILGVDESTVIEKSKKTDSWYETIARKIDDDKADKIRQFINENNLKGVHLEVDTKRYYPYSSLASHVIGFVGADNDGLDGIELGYNSYLTGTNGSIVRLKSANGTDMLISDFEDYYDAVDGYDVTLTIDSTVQYYVEKYLQQAIEDYQAANGGACIIMDPNTGGILAMASMGNFDLNDYDALDPDVQAEIDAMQDEEERKEAYSNALFAQWRNKAVSDTYEPGSVFKIITCAMALEENVVTDGDTFYCGGSMDVLGRTSPLNCWKSAGHGTQTLKQAMQHSCNVALVNIGLRVGAEKFYEYVDAFGFFETTGIDLQGESDSLWWNDDVFCDPDNLSQLAAASFGQTFNITPIELVTAISAVANGGYLMTPYLVKEVSDSDGNIIMANEAKVKRQVISEETSKQVCAILESVVGESEGTGKNAYVAGYRVGGKTGTTTKTTKEATTGEKEYIVSFCGIAPADDPQVVILLLLDSPPRSGATYVSGGQMAAPVVGSILSEVLPYLGIQPKYTDEELASLDVTVPTVTGSALTQAQQELENAGYTVTVKGSGETVTAQLPAANAVVASGSEVILYTEGEARSDDVTVPDLYGLTYSEAKQRLEYYGLYVKYSSGTTGSGSSSVVSKQSKVYGDSVKFGTVIEVTLVDKSNLGQY